MIGFVNKKYLLKWFVYAKSELMKKIKVSSEFLKWFALIAMTADHIDRIYVNLGWLSHSLGRMAFPIFSFLLLSNFVTYHPVKKYLIRLGAFATLSQALFFLFHFESPNILFSFFYAILFIFLVERISHIFKNFYVQAYFSFLVLMGIFPFILKADYSLLGFFFLLALYAYFRQKSKLNYVAVLLTGIFVNFDDIMTILITLSTLIILLSGIQIIRGRRLMKWWFFYLYYPLHKLALYVLKIL